ncbi:hypothetical protein HGO38_15385 [Rhizobium sp. CG5]|uniref:hypothetical protein n=1 Tax=Rhizobium sp. CG5 TaxID=2726076 RepID=UPI0020342C7E|nr:hypothetical protein [Rhizobium sp. CG5]MCM2474863.1 hypothetical protein [Rhizobium sp. CG5]
MDNRFSSGLSADEQPLVSNRFLFGTAIVIGLLALLSGGISIAGHWFGERLSLAGHSVSSDIYTVSIGQDRLRLTANTIRFEGQRHDGPAQRVDLYLLWPEMTGYHQEYRRRFDDISLSDTLLFLQISQSTMSRDMSGRIEPIYSKLFSGPPEQGPYGLTLHRLRSETGYENEVLLTAPRLGQPDYAVRCILPKPGTPASSGDCQRDIHVGRDLSVLYRFSSSLLADWDRIDDAVRSYMESRISDAPHAALPFDKKRTDNET